MEEKEIVRLYLLEGILKNLTNNNKTWDSICMSSPLYGVILFRDMYEAIMNGKILSFFKTDYVDLFIEESKNKGLELPTEESVHTIDELKEMYPILNDIIDEEEKPKEE